MNSENGLPVLSVCIISKNRRDSLSRLLRSIEQLDYDRAKMQVVVLEETDCPAPFSAEIEYHAIPVRNKGFGFARNEILRYACAPVIVFVDDDCVVDSNWLRNLVLPLQQDSSIAAVGGAIQVPSCGNIGKCESVLGFPGGGVKYIFLANGKIVDRSTFSTCNCAIRRSAIDMAGGFDENLEYGGEDEMLSRRISSSSRVVFNGAAIVYHEPRDSIRGVFTWFKRRGKGAVSVALMHAARSQTALRHLPHSPLVRIGALLSVLLILRIPLWIAAVAIGAWYGVIISRYRWCLRFFAWPVLLLVPIVRTVMDTGYDIGFFGQVFRKNERSG